jgi:DNA-binding response OmpR family regulator
MMDARQEIPPKTVPGILNAMITIAIYEPDGSMNSLLVEWLSQAGYYVHESAVAERGPAVDLVIVSIQMPKNAGVDVIRAMRVIHPETPFIALSSQFRSGLSSCGAAAQTLGVTRVLAKPLTRNELLAAVQGVIGPGGGPH